MTVIGNLLSIVEDSYAVPAVLYHACPIQALNDVIAHNYIKGTTRYPNVDGPDYYGLSLTRNLSFAKEFGKNNIKPRPVILALNASKLREHFQIENRIGQVKGINIPSPTSGKKQEEFIVVGYDKPGLVQNIKDYILEILVNSKTKDLNVIKSLMKTYNVEYTLF